ncbi:MAG: hypothetical protein ACM3ZA_09760 [Bacillota bacterium]
MRREHGDNGRYPLRGEERYTWDPRHWDNQSQGYPRQYGAGEEEEEERPTWMRAVEQLLLRLVVLGLVALVLVQLWQRGAISQWLQLSQFEGNALTREQQRLASGAGVPATAAEPLTLTVTLVNADTAPDVRLLVDGREAGRFTSGTLTVAAPAGARLTLEPGGDARLLSFRITALSDRSRQPRLGTQVTTRGTAVELGRVE